MNPYEAPESEIAADITPGSFQIGVALTRAWDALQANPLPLLVAPVIVGVSIVISLCTVIGVFIVAPLMTWGMLRMQLDALRGEEVRLDTLIAPFNRIGELLLPMLGVSLFVALAAAPPSLLDVMRTLLIEDEMLLAISAFVSLGFSLLWAALISVRLGFASYFVVDKGMGAIDALTASWVVSSSEKLRLVGTLATVYLITIVGLCLCFVGIYPASVITSLMMASIYEQLNSAD